MNVQPNSFLTAECKPWQTIYIAIYTYNMYVTILYVKLTDTSWKTIYLIGEFHGFASLKDIGHSKYTFSFSIIQD